MLLQIKKIRWKWIKWTIKKVEPISTKGLTQIWQMDIKFLIAQNIFLRNISKLFNVYTS